MLGAFIGIYSSNILICMDSGIISYGMGCALGLGDGCGF